MATKGSCTWACGNNTGLTESCTYTVSGNLNCDKNNWNNINIQNSRSRLINMPGYCFGNCDQIPMRNNTFEQKILEPGSDSSKFTKFIMRDMF